MSWALPLTGHLLGKCIFLTRTSKQLSTRPIVRSSLTPTRSLLTPSQLEMEETIQVKMAQLQAELDSLHKAINVLNQLAAELDIHTAMQNVRQVALELLDCERVTLFLIFERRRELRAMIDQNEILRIKFGEGIAGLVAQTGGSMNLPDVYEHPMFNKEVDRLTGFRTRSMLCMAVSDMTGKNVAVLQALNKKSGQSFTPADERNLKLFGTHLGNTLVKAKLHETAKREKERLQAIYNCFKSLSTAEEVGQMVECATASLERRVIHADRVFFFLVDKPRGELWLHTLQGEAIRLRIGPPGGVVGLCAESRKPQSWAEFDDPSQDPALRRLAAQLAPARIKSVLVQPIHGTNNDRVLAVVLAVNKREAEGTSDIFFEPFFTDADCDAMALFAYEVGDLLSERSLELSLLSALSVVGHDGAHPNVARTSLGEGSGGEGGGGDGEGDTGSVSGAGDEDFIRSQLIQMYLPEYKKEIACTHGVFNRNSFSAASATANQVRASMERKRSALFGADSQSSKRSSTRQREAASASGRLGLVLAAATARSSLLSLGRMQTRRSAGGEEDAVSGGPLALAGRGGNFGYGTEPPGSPAMGSDASGDLSILADLGALRCHSSTQVEHPSITMRTLGAAAAAAAGGGMYSGRSLTSGMPHSSTLTHAQALLQRGGGSGVQTLGRPISGPCAAAVLPLFPGPGGQHNRQSAGGPGAGTVAVVGGGEGPATARRNTSMVRLMAPSRRPLHGLGACSASAGSGGLGSLSGDSTPSGDDAELVVATAGEGANGLLYQVPLPPVEVPELPMPFAVLDSVEEELRKAVDASMRSTVADPQALRSHLSCSDLTQANSPRSPCFYPLDQLCSWDWDFTEFSVEELIKLAYDIIIVSGAMAEFALKPKVLRNFLTAVASHYHAIPYHNFNHVVHVLHATFLISTTTRAVDVLKPLERFALLLAALCHDLDHDGHSNSFHVNSCSELSRIYNDQSVMENHHCAMTFAILSRTDCNVLAVLAPDEQRAVRKAIISAILCTDMANHFALTQEFQKHSVAYEPDNEADRLLLLKVTLHAADIGNAVRPFHVNHAMSRRVHREFEAQAEEEVRLGLPITFSVDTSDHVMCARVELNFLDYVVTALWEQLVDVLPELAPQMAQLRVNRARYRRIADTGKTAEQVLAEEAGQQAEESAEPVGALPKPNPGSDRQVAPPAPSCPAGADAATADAPPAVGNVGDGGDGDSDRFNRTIRPSFVKVVVVEAAASESRGKESMAMSPLESVSEAQPQQTPGEGTSAMNDPAESG